MTKPRLYVMVGNIVSGKSTWIKKFLETVSPNDSFSNNLVVISKDDLRKMIGAGRYVYNEKLEPIIHESVLSMLSWTMRRKQNIIIDETNMDKITRNQYLFLTKNVSCLGYEYETIAVVIPNPSKEEVEKRIAFRRGQRKWASTPVEVWINVWERKQSLYEEPTEKEGFNQIWKIE